MGSILVVEDEQSMREFLEIMLLEEGHDLELVASAAEAFEVLDAGADFDLVLTDLRIDERDSGLKVLRHVKHLQPHTEVIVITAFATTDSAIQAMKDGAYDYVTKPFKVDEARLLIAKALEKNRLSRERLHLQREVQNRFSFGNIVGGSSVMGDVFDLIRKVSPTRTNVLVCGESGTGKELVARAIHYNSPRSTRSFVAVNCAAVTESLFESELFGHVKGAFTGAVVDKPGLFERADGGTLFLDEIGEVPPSIQVKLLRVLQDRMVTRVGGTRSKEVDVRIIAATNKKLEEEVETGEFREDLYYRLNVIRIDLPPLRQRPEDVPLLVRAFLDKFGEEMRGGASLGIAPEALESLQDYTFPGNVRELENIVERAVTLSAGDTVTRDSLPPAVLSGERLGGVRGINATEDFPEEGVVIDEVLGRIEKDLILEAMRRSKGVKTRAAELLGLSFRQFRYRLEKIDLGDDVFK